MTTSFASAVPRFKEAGNGANCKVDSYNAVDPSNPPLGVIDPARKSVVFASTSPQRVNVIQNRTANFVGPGAYDPKYSLIFPDLIRLHQFDGKRSAMFASTSQRFRSKKVVQAPDVRWSLEKDAAYWQSNRDGGGCWGKAHARESGTIALMERKLREAAAAQGGIGADDPDCIINQPRRFHQVVSFVPLDLCFRDMQDVQDILREEPLPLYNGKVPTRVEAPRAESAGPAAAEADAERMPRRGSVSQIEEVEPSPDEIALPHRFVCNTRAPRHSNRPHPATALAAELPRARACRLRLNNNLLPSVAQLPRVLGALLADVAHLALLDLSFNKLTRIEPALGTLANLEMLRLHANQLEHIEDLVHLKPLKQLKRLTLMSNPLEAKTADYRCLVGNSLPSLRSLDNVRITKSELVAFAAYAESSRGKKALLLRPRQIKQARPGSASAY